MRKIASHYYLRPDNSIGKFPVITFDSSGRIIEVRERVQFSEEPFMEHVNGLIVPKLISSVSSSFFLQDKEEQLLRLRQFVKRGNISVKCDLNNISELNELIKVLPRLTSFSELNAEDYDAYADLISSESILDFFNSNNFGTISEGNSSGLLAISGVGKEPFRWNSKSKMKIII
ncbi:hypothetical protein [Saccharicrinis aurantiacus]|uniref:hypothetical protein n=1 Tax=Saccharicrinis aurantiacus TaxID=1849719 RepID=UPI00094F608D|nr:hypothetical protein [Saccharicrinis aurantiacus]